LLLLSSCLRRGGLDHPSEEASTIRSPMLILQTGLDAEGSVAVNQAPRGQAQVGQVLLTSDRGDNRRQLAECDGGGRRCFRKAGEIDQFLGKHQSKEGRCGLGETDVGLGRLRQ
jgi:hypothetical protein